MTPRDTAPPTSGGRVRVRVAPIASAAWSGLAVGLAVGLGPPEVAAGVASAWAVALITWSAVRGR